MAGSSSLQERKAGSDMPAREFVAEGVEVRDNGNTVIYHQPLPNIMSTVDTGRLDAEKLVAIAIAEKESDPQKAEALKAAALETYTEKLTALQEAAKDRIERATQASLQSITATYDPNKFAYVLRGQGSNGLTYVPIQTEGISASNLERAKAAHEAATGTTLNTILTGSTFNDLQYFDYKIGMDPEFGIGKRKDLYRFTPSGSMAKRCLTMMEGRPQSWKPQLDEVEELGDQPEPTQAQLDEFNRFRQVFTAPPVAGTRVNGHNSAAPLNGPNGQTHPGPLAPKPVVN